jgi:AcrR family transcriptional regulator
MTADQLRDSVTRADRVLDAAEDLMLRWGYKRVTIEDVADRAEIGKGTVYLHFRTRDELFAAVVLREKRRIMAELLARVRSDPVNVLPHRVYSASFETCMRRPLAKALYTGDLDLLGKLAKSGGPAAHAEQLASARFTRRYLATLREHGLVRQTDDPEAQLYALAAVNSGFYLLEPLLDAEPPEPIGQLSLAAKAAVIAQLVRDAFETPGEPDPASITAVAANVLAIFQDYQQGRTT